ncbi:ABC transporter permease [Haloimpatiens sp. FM7315]|uniref:ABC transporter permease n=1 Tax=Haloimpatiens sp. FM7315 TaxID=3298609 RepID=UPI00370C60FB
MQLFNLALANVKKNFKNYFIYVVSMIFSVTIYFIFKSIEHNNEINKVLSSTAKLSDAFKAASIVIAIFSSVFVWYSNSFFIKRRKKEIGLYSLLGIEKKQIGRMLFYETLAIGTMSLTLGILVGMFLSKIFIGILIKIIGISAVINFTISISAIKDTIIIFSILFVIISLHGYSIIYSYELIELFKAENKGEKEPKASIIFAIASLLFIGSGYYIYTHPLQSFMMTILLTLILVVLGTYILFGSFIIFVIKVSKRNEKRYFKGLNMIGTSQLLYRIKGNAKTLATIAILSATTLTAMGVSISYYKYFSDNMNKSMPFSYVSTLSSKEFDDRFKNIVNKHKNNKLLHELHLNVAEVKTVFPNDEKGEELNVISEGQLIDIFKARNMEFDMPKIKTEDEVIIFDESYNENYMENYTGENITMNFSGDKEEFKVIDLRSDLLVNEHILFKTAVVKDSVYEKYNLKEKSNELNAYIIENQEKSEELDKEVNKFYKEIRKKIFEEGNDKRIGQVSSYYSTYKDMSVTVGVMLFIGIFLGLVFLVCTGSIIFFKQLSEAEEEIERYDILRKVGVDNEEIRINIFKQMVFVFLTPFVVGSIHSVVAVSLIAKAVEINILYPLILSSIPYLLIYIIYYFITSNFYYKTVTRKA